MKEQFGEAWKPLVAKAVEANDPTGCLYSTKDRRTVIEFRVAADGTIAGTKARGNCGNAPAQRR